MQDIGVVQQDSTVRIMFVTRDGSGGAVAPSTAFENADVEIYKDGSATQRSSDAGITMTSPFDTVTGLHLLAIDLSDNTDAGFWAAGSNYHVTIQPDETVDGQTVVEVLAQFTIETDTQKALRTFNSAAFITDTVTTTTSNTTTAVNLTDFLDAQAPDNSTTGELWLWQDSTGELEYFRVQSMTSLVATVEAWPAGGALSAAVAASDKLWRVGYVDVNTAAISDDIVAADNWEEFASAIVTGIAGATSLSTTTCSSDLTSYADDELIGRTIIFTSGTAAGQAARVTDYANTNGVLTFTAITTAPLQNDIFVVV